MKKFLKLGGWLSAAAGAMALVAFTLISNQRKAKQEIEKDMTPVPFTVMASYVQEKTFSNEATYRGSIEASEITDVYSEADGKLVRFPLTKGQTVHSGQVLGMLDQSTRLPANEINRANYEKARSDYKKLSELLAGNNASGAEVEAAATQLKTVEAQLNISTRQIRQTIIRAPASGMVIQKKARTGDYIQLGAPLATIANLNTVIARIFVPELLVTGLYQGMMVQLKADAYPDIVFTGQLKLIVPVANEAKAFPVEIQIQNNRHQKLLAGMSVSAAIHPLKPATALVIPRTALTGDIARPVVYVIDAGKKPIRRELQLGRDFGTLLEVKTGLAKGETIITSGQANIEPGKILTHYTMAKE